MSTPNLSQSPTSFPSTYSPTTRSRLDYFYDRPGTTPGKLNLRQDANSAELVLIDYNATDLQWLQIEPIDTIKDYLDTDSVSWIDMLGLGNLSNWEALSQIFNFHRLLVEDIVNVPQRPKVEHFPDCLLLITTMIVLQPHGDGFTKEQVSFVLGKNFLLTVQEEPEYDCFHGVRDRIKNSQGMIREHGSDYLTFCLLDAIIDGFFPVLEYYGELIEELEDEVVTKPDRGTLEKIYKVRRELLTIRRAIWPQREAINSLIRDGSDLISSEVQVYLRDCYDHAIQVMDMVETYRELSTGLMDVYLSSVGNKMNEIMKFLTVVSSIFIPLTFIAGIYGMNFNPDKSPWNMPELNWYWGYPACLLLMLVVGGSSMWYFWRQGWFKNFSTPRS
jgi:magnesium transporter